MLFFSEFEYFKTSFVNPEVAFALRIISINDPNKPQTSITQMFPVSDAVA